MLSTVRKAAPIAAGVLLGFGAIGLAVPAQASRGAGAAAPRAESLAVVRLMEANTTGDEAVEQEPAAEDANEAVDEVAEQQQEAQEEAAEQAREAEDQAAEQAVEAQEQAAEQAREAAERQAEQRPTATAPAESEDSSSGGGDGGGSHEGSDDH
jgi:hypothetical protein